MGLSDHSCCIADQEATATFQLAKMVMRICASPILQTRVSFGSWCYVSELDSRDGQCSRVIPKRVNISLQFTQAPSFWRLVESLAASLTAKVKLLSSYSRTLQASKQLGLCLVLLGAVSLHS